LIVGYPTSSSIEWLTWYLFFQRLTTLMQVRCILPFCKQNLNRFVLGAMENWVVIFEWIFTVPSHFILLGFDHWENLRVSFGPQTGRYARFVPCSLHLSQNLIPLPNKRRNEWWFINPTRLLTCKSQCTVSCDSPLSTFRRWFGNITTMEWWSYLYLNEGEKNSQHEIQ
jgi:hypothetical protein